MRKLVISLALVFILLFAIVIPVSASNIDTISYQIGTGTLVYKLGLGNTYIDIGTVTVSSDATNLYVQYDTADGYLMTETHMGAASGTTIAAAIAKIPTSPGQMDKPTFPAGYWGGSAVYPSPYVSTYTYTIPLSVFTDITDNWVVIAAHAAITGDDSGTAWATGSGDPPFNPTPELPAGILLGLGLVGVGSFILIKRKARVNA
jgi:hypothetical protein